MLKFCARKSKEGLRMIQSYSTIARFLVADGKSVPIKSVSTKELRLFLEIICEEISRRGKQTESSADVESAARTYPAMIFVKGEREVSIQKVPVYDLEATIARLCHAIGKKESYAEVIPKSEAGVQL